MSRTCELTNIGVATGNKVSHSVIKTKRRFLPNLQNVNLKSDALGVDLNLRLATRTIRTINKYGSLDSFLVNYSYSKLSEKGKILRRRIMKKLIETNKLEDVKIIKGKKTA